MFHLVTPSRYCKYMLTIDLSRYLNILLRLQRKYWDAIFWL